MSNSIVDLRSLGVTWSPRDPRFAGSNPVEVNGFFRRKNPERKSLLREKKHEEIGLWAKFNLAYSRPDNTLVSI